MALQFIAFYSKQQNKTIWFKLTCKLDFDLKVRYRWLRRENSPHAGFNMELKKVN